MTKVNTNKEKIKEILERGVEKIYPSRKKLEKKLLSGDRTRLYCGFDPSASSLHIGNAIQINKLAQFQELGHEVIFLIGDFTGMIGDPTDKSSARQKMTREKVLENSKNYKKEASAFLDFKGKNPARVEHNSKWSDKMSFKDLIELSSNFTVQQMIVRDMFKERMKKEMPIYLHEFLYPLAQGYDAVAMDVDLEIGGNDQMFNMMCGRDLQRIINKKEKFVMTLKLLADDKGAKMGKTEGNAVFLNETPENMYGIIMSWPDGVIGAGFELCAKVPMSEVKEIYKQLKEGKVNPRDLKMKLAYEITKINHGEVKAKKAEGNFVRTIQNKAIPLDIESVAVASGHTTTTNLVSELFDTSKSEARRLIKQGGIKLDGKVETEADKEIDIPPKGKIVQKGKKNFRKAIKK